MCIFKLNLTAALKSHLTFCQVANHVQDFIYKMLACRNCKLGEYFILALWIYAHRQK